MVPPQAVFGEGVAMINMFDRTLILENGTIIVTSALSPVYVNYRDSIGVSILGKKYSPESYQTSTWIWTGHNISTWKSTVKKMLIKLVLKGPTVFQILNPFWVYWVGLWKRWELSVWKKLEGDHTGIFIKIEKIDFNQLGKNHIGKD